MNTLFTRSLLNKLIQLLLIVALPVLGWAQTVIVNYDFNSANAYPVAPVATAPNVNSVATSSSNVAFATAMGVASGTGAYAVNAVGPALNMPNSSGNNTKYFQFDLTGADLPKYAAFKIYLQGRRSNTGAATLTLQYSVNGGSYGTFGNTYAPGNASFTERNFDLSDIPDLNKLNSLSFRLLASGASGNGTLQIDNFQVQAVNTVDPLLNMLAPATAEAGTPGFDLTVTGSNFKLGAVLSFNGQALATAYNSSTSLVATVPAAAIATAGSYPVVVTNPGNAASAAVSFFVTPARVHWTGRVGNNGSGSWFDAGNWSTGSPPALTDEVALDHLYVAVSYTVSLDQNTAVSIKSLTVNPGVGDSIFVIVPDKNTLPTALTLSSTGAGAVALAIYDKGVVTNDSGAPIGSAGIDVANVTDSNPGATVFIYNGGSYRQASKVGHRLVAENLSAANGTEQGIFDFRLPATAASSYALSTSARTYGALILRNRPGTAKSGYIVTASLLTIRGDLLIGSGVTLTATINNDFQILGNIRSQGSLQVANPSCEL